MLRKRTRHRLYAALFLLLLVWGAVLASYAGRPPLATPQTSDYPNNAAGEHSAPDKTTEAQQPKSLWQETTADPIALFTFWIAVLTGVLAFSTIGLWVTAIRGGRTQARDVRQSLHLAKRSLRATETAANAARKSAEISAASRKSSEQQLRAYLSVTPHFQGEEIDKRAPHYAITIKNRGRTPAYQVRGWTDGVLADYPLADSLPSTKKPPGPIRTLSPDAEEQINGFFGNPLSLQDAHRVMDGSLRYFFWGEVTYVDAFKIPRRVRFRYMFGGTSARVGKVDICEEYSD